MPLVAQTAWRIVILAVSVASKAARIVVPTAKKFANFIQTTGHSLTAASNHLRVYCMRSAAWDFCWLNDIGILIASVLNAACWCLDCASVSQTVRVAGMEHAAAQTAAAGKIVSVASQIVAVETAASVAVIHARQQSVVIVVTIMMTVNAVPAQVSNAQNVSVPHVTVKLPNAPSVNGNVIFHHSTPCVVTANLTAPSVACM